MNYEKVDEALDDLIRSIRATVAEDEVNKVYQLEAELNEINAQYIALQKRTSGMSGMLQRIRVKCDTATGMDFDEDMDEQGRAMGAEGALGRLLAYTLGTVFTKSKEGLFIELDLHDQIQALEAELEKYRGTKTE